VRQWVSAGLARRVRTTAWLVGAALSGGVAAQAPSAAASAPVGTPAAATPAANRLPVETFFARPQVREIRLSPSGERVAVTTARGSNRVALVVFDLSAAGQPARRIAQFEDVDIVGVQWLDEQRLLFSVSDLDAAGGEAQRIGRGLYLAHTDGSQLRNLIQRQAALVVESSTVQRRSLLPNHRLLAVPERGEGVDPDEIIVGAYGGDRENPTVQPGWLNVRTMRVRDGDFVAPPGGAQSWRFDSRGRAVAALSRSGTQSRLYVRQGEQWVPSPVPTGEGGVTGVLAVADSGERFVTVREGPERRTVLKRWPAEATAPLSEPFVRVDGFDFAGSLLFEGQGAQQRLTGVRVDGEVRTTAWLDPAMQQLQREADTRWPGRVNELSCRRCGSPDATVLLFGFSDRDPGEVWLWRAATAQWRPVARVLPEVEPARMARVDLQRIAARDGRELPLWMTLPAGVPEGQPAPTVVLVHGGPWLRGGFWRWDPMAQFLASRGWLVLQPDFRGSAGYGQRHLAAGFRQWGRAMQDDVADALLWARAKGLAHPQKACIIGASYGGYATMMGLVRHPELYRCGASWLGVADLMLYLKGSWFVQDDIPDGARGQRLPVLVGDAEREADRLREVSPVEQAARIRAPLLLAWGGQDLRVPPEHGERMVAALRKAGREPETVVYPDEAHGWRKLANELDFARRLEQFLSRHLDHDPPR
jgi:dipeptidyl aminopeptidase/acylaminoacyl peptidase